MRLARAARVHTPVLGPSRHGPRQAGACQEPRGFPGGGRVGGGAEAGLHRSVPGHDSLPPGAQGWAGEDSGVQGRWVWGAGPS